jgi:hypothetical protein
MNIALGARDGGAQQTRQLDCGSSDLSGVAACSGVVGENIFYGNNKRRGLARVLTAKQKSRDRIQRHRPCSGCCSL